jgi:hypothetical protein
MIDESRYSRKMNWGIFIILVFLMFALLLLFDRAIASETRDPKAVAIAEKMISAMGGLDGWKRVRGLRFNFQVEKEGAPPRAVKHLWDRAGGRDHVEWSKDNKPTVAWINLKSKEGAAWMEGRKLEGEELKQALDSTYGRWVNDTYWLIMPFKVLDNGVNLKYEGEKDGHDVLHLSFGTVGLTPKDQYWAYINQTTHLMDRWQFHLQDEKEKDPGFNWLEWGNYGPVKLSKLKESADKKLKIRFEPLEAVESPDSSYFSQEMKALP